MKKYLISLVRFNHLLICSCQKCTENKKIYVIFLLGDGHIRYSVCPNDLKGQIGYIYKYIFVQYFFLKCECRKGSGSWNVDKWF